MKKVKTVSFAGTLILLLAIGIKLFLNSDKIFKSEIDPYPYAAQSNEPELIIAKLEQDDFLISLLEKKGLSSNEVYGISKAIDKVYPVNLLRPGNEFYLYLQNKKLEHFVFRPNFEKTIFIDVIDGGYNTREVISEYKSQRVGISGEISTSLYIDATKSGIPDRIVDQFTKIYEYSVDFQRDIRPGDKFTMYFDAYKNRKGDIVKTGDLLYTSFSPGDKKSEFWLFSNEKKSENFYDENGKTAKRRLRATPINGARISSGFGGRKHPILGYKKMHTGVDFAAPRGTPVLAAGSGTVEYAAWNGAAGKYIRIRHTDGYKTAYFHLSRINVSVGKYVKQDQIIGKVGSTGRSTGPHLHYEVILNGKKINPKRLSQLSGKPLGKAEMNKFNKRREEIEKMRTSDLNSLSNPI
ncbi:M23 family metallopeptidase [Hellea sp.]|nr:M23 family metallopeptidase [Hellea sp.]MDA8887560.1 M23 family metallopeptidase [Hellea sp.]MDB4844270.1 M23 family metallopeptidase [Hellea sp.]MDC1061236.1 M23 family metallopeptidase [Hellea sp.]